MPTRTPLDTAALDSLLRAQERIAAHPQLVELGMERSTISYRIRPGGPWQRLFPGVVLAHTGRATRRELLLGALAYAGDESIVTGLPGLRLHDIRAADRPPYVPHILIPHVRRRTAHHFAIMERCRLLPEPLLRRGIRVAPVAKCVVDAARRVPDADGVRDIVAESIQTGKCTVEQLVIEVRRTARQRTALTRVALREIAAGVRSVAEARIRRAVLASGLPVPLFNPQVFTRDGEFIASPDGYFPDCAAGWEVDSFAFHMSRADYLRTQRRHRRVTTHGLILIPVSPVDGAENPDGFIADLWGLREMATQREIPDLVVRPVTTAA